MKGEYKQRTEKMTKANFPLDYKYDLRIPYLPKQEKHIFLKNKLNMKHKKNKMQTQNNLFFESQPKARILGQKKSSKTILKIDTSFKTKNKPFVSNRYLNEKKHFRTNSLNSKNFVKKIRKTSITNSLTSFQLQKIKDHIKEIKNSSINDNKDNNCMLYSTSIEFDFSNNEVNHSLQPECVEHNNLYNSKLSEKGIKHRRLLTEMIPNNFDNIYRAPRISGTLISFSYIKL